jgi:DNA modification methylase
MLVERTIYCKIICGDSREVLPTLTEKANLIVTSPPYADARKEHYDSIHPDKYAKWFMTFHRAFYDALADDGSFVLNIKDKVVKGRRHRFVWQTIMELEAAGWYS